MKTIHKIKEIHAFNQNNNANKPHKLSDLILKWILYLKPLTKIIVRFNKIIQGPISMLLKWFRMIQIIQQVIVFSLRH